MVRARDTDWRFKREKQALASENQKLNQELPIHKIRLKIETLLVENEAYRQQVQRRSREVNSTQAPPSPYSICPN